MDDGRSDFDFVFGEWEVHNRKLRDPLDPACTEWVEFDSRSAAEPILHGLGNVDRIWCEGTEAVPAFEGFTLRLFDPGVRQWRIWWSSTRQPGLLDPPVEGRFADGSGVFEAADVLGGRPAIVRFGWTPHPTTPRWEQAFSFDDGETFVHNWTMDFARVDE
jgi:hypothetical protein